jgi:hypothetical protein
MLAAESEGPMRRHRLALIAIAAVVVVVGACGGGGGAGGGSIQTAGEPGVQALVAADIAARRAEDTNKRYSLESPAYRAACDVNHFAIAAGNDWYGIKVRGIAWADVDARDVKVTVNGNAAKAVFIVTAKGQDLFKVGDPNLYQAVYVDGQWWKNDLDENNFLGQPC